MGDRVIWDKGQPFSVFILSQQQPTHFSLPKHFLLDFSRGHLAFGAAYDPPPAMGTLMPCAGISPSIQSCRGKLKCGQSDPPSRNIGPRGGAWHSLHAPGSSLSSSGSAGPLQPVSPVSLCWRARLGFCGFHPKLRCHQRPDLLPSTNKHLTNLGPSSPRPHAVMHSGHLRPCWSCLSPTPGTTYIQPVFSNGKCHLIHPAFLPQTKRHLDALLQAPR